MIRFILLFSILLFTECSFTKKISVKNYTLKEALSHVWYTDTCGFQSGERRTVAEILHYYLYVHRSKIHIKDLESIIGKCDEVRSYDNRRYDDFMYYIGVKPCPEGLQSGVIFNVTVNKRNGKVLGSSIHLWEPDED